MAVGLPPRYPNDVQSGKTTPSFPLSQNYVVTRLQWLFLVRYQVSVSGVLTWCGSGWQRLTDNSMKGGAWLVLVSRRLVTCLLHMAALNCCYQLRYRQQWWVATYARRWRTTYPLLRGLVHSQMLCAADHANRPATRAVRSTRVGPSCSF